MPTITDWIMVAITAIYVLATIIICFANYKSAKATREQVAEAKRQYEESNRAFVTVSFEIVRSGLAVLRIQNIGKRIASNVNLQISPDFVVNIANKHDKEHIERLCMATFTLGIGQSWYICLGSHLEIKQMSNELLSIDITYEDFASKYDDKIVIDLKQYFWALMYESPTEDAYQELKKMTRSVQSMDKSIKRIQQGMPQTEETPTDSQPNDSFEGSKVNWQRIFKKWFRRKI